MSQQPENPTPEDQPQDSLSLLRELIVGPEAVKIDTLEKRLDDPELHASDIARILPEAIEVRTEQDNKLEHALLPVVETAIKTSISRDPRPLSDALFPVMGPAIRKAIASTLSHMVQSLNQTLEYAFSVQGLKWRMESLRTGRPFAEVVMLNTLVYRVEQVFLIHRETGLLLQHALADQVKAQDADMVSGMMTAIQDFVRDSFGVGESEGLEEMQVGDLQVWLEAGPKAILAVCVRGSAPKQLRTMMQEVNESIHHQFSRALNDFQGDVSAFAGAQQDLVSCLQAQYAKQVSGDKPKRSWKLPAIALLLLSGLLFWIGSGYYAHHRFMQLVSLLKQQPGLMIIEATDDTSPYQITALRDPLSMNPASIIHQQGYTDSDIHLHMIPYQSLQEDFVLLRAKQILSPPESVSLRIEQGILHASGTASLSWIERVRNFAPLIAGITRFDSSGLEQQYSDAWILQQATALLKPPVTVEISVKNRVLTARGEAPQAWIEQAREQAPGILQGLQYIDHALINIDSPEYILARAEEQLQPPASLRLTLKDGTLIAHGKASSGWILQTQSRATSIHGVQRYDDSHVIDTGSDAYILAEAKRILSPPSSVSLSLNQGILFARGTADGEWIHQARIRSQGIAGIQKLDDSRLVDTGANAYILAQAKAKLRPPATVSLSFANGTLRADGVANSDWKNKAMGLATSVNGVHAFDSSGIKPDPEEQLQHLQNQLASFTVRFIPERSVLATGQMNALRHLADMVNDALPILTAQNYVLEVIGFTNMLGVSTRSNRLAMDRAAAVKHILVDNGLPEKRVMIRSDADGGGKMATFSLRRLSPQDMKEQ